MTEVLRLDEVDCRLLSARFRQHANSHRRMAGALREAGALEMLDRLRALRGLERRFAIDLGSLCHRFERRNDAGTHPIERSVLSYVARERTGPDGRMELLVLVDRVRSVRALIERGPLVYEPD
jgi:hypothetical protein